MVRIVASPRMASLTSLHLGGRALALATFESAAAAMHANIDFVWFLNFPGNYLLNLFPKCLRHSTQATHIQPIFCRRAL